MIKSSIKDRISRMDQSKTQIEKWTSKIKNNPVVAVLLLLGTAVTALASFTNAAKSLMDLAVKDTRPAINGEWKADVTYDWNAQYPETFSFKGEGNEVQGMASFLKIKRGILQGKVAKDQLQFITKTQEVSGDHEPKETVHRYSGKLDGDHITFTMQTEGGDSEHKPIEFVAQKVLDQKQP